MIEGEVSAEKSEPRVRPGKMRLWILPVGVAVTLVTVLGPVFILRWATDEPLCQGKPIRVWVDEIASAQYGDRDLAEEQLQTAGQAAVSAIIEALRNDRSSLRNRINDWWTRTWFKLPQGLRQVAPRPRPYFRPDRRMWINSLGRLGPHDQRVVEALIRELNSQEPEVRFFATHTFGEIADKWSDEPQTQQQIIAVLTQMLEDPAYNVRGAAAYGLAKCGAAARPCIPALVRMLQDSDDHSRMAAVRAISYIGGDTNVILPAITPLLQDKGALTRAFAAYTVCQVTGAADCGLHGLIELLHAGDSEASSLAAALLGRFGKTATNALPDLEHALQDSESGVRIAAARSIWKISGNASRSLPVLQLLLTTGSGGEQIKITELLGDFGPEALPVLSELIAATQDRDFLIRRNAVRAIENIGPAAKEAIPTLEILRKDPFPSIRAAADEAISKISAK